jgi:hypothetical protein
MTVIGPAGCGHQIGYEMPPDLAATHARRVPKRRSRQQPFDGRFAWENRRRALVLTLTPELGREPSVRDIVLVANTAAAIVRLEQLQDRITRGVEVDDEALSRATNVVTRLIAALGIRAAPRPAPAQLTEILNT